MLVSILFVLIGDGFKFSGASIFGLAPEFIGIILGTIILSFFMIIDDIKGLRAQNKLLVQIFVSLIIIASGVGINSLANPFGNPVDLNSIYIPIFSYQGQIYHFSLLSDLLTLVWLVGMMNVMNFVDGIDGLAGGLAGIAGLILFSLSMSFGVGQSATALLSIVLAGAAFGFLVWNFPPAKIFMGDSGSMFLGFILGVLPLISGGKLATSFLVLGFPIIDGLLVAAGRVIRGKNPATPDKTHLHHRFLTAGFSARQAVLFMYIIAAVFGWVALRSTTLAKAYSAGILVFLLVILIIVLSYIGKLRTIK
ncbi:MAG: MraY family glycosyltransferase [Patescibacteria group bacterium]